MDDELFDELIRRSIRKIPKEFLERLENVEIVSQDFLYPHQIQFLRERGEKGLLLGLYEGIPQTKRGRYGIGATLPDKITIFKKALISISTDIHQLETNVRKTVVHEIAHHFGMTEEEIHKAVSDID
jgi:predicted Zn-dependent protease with MMP-like domain